MVTGLILLVFIGLLLAFFFSRFRRQLGLAAPGRMWVVIVVAVVLIGLFLWASSTHR